MDKSQGFKSRNLKLPILNYMNRSEHYVEVKNIKGLHSSHLKDYGLKIIGKSENSSPAGVTFSKEGWSPSF
jgi:hypothetical protein